MKVSQFGTKITALVMAMSFFSSPYAMALETVQVKIETSPILQRLQAVYGAHNRPLPRSLTQETKAVLTDPAEPRAKLPDQRRIRMGGVSDGGGNAVGGTFFDFYENEGSQEITIDELIYIEPVAAQVLASIDKNVAGINFVESGSLTILMKKALEKKKIYLESKEIFSEACRNQSLVSTPDQVVVGCQSDTEVRFNVGWMSKTDGQNRAGLIVHELVLAWAREEYVDVEKEVVEDRVRNLNRAFFSGLTDEEVSSEVREITGKHVFNAYEVKIAESLPGQVVKARAEFCKNPKTDVTTRFASILNDKELMKKGDVIDGRLQTLVSASAQARKGQTTGYKSVCAGYFIDQKPIHAPTKGFVDTECGRQMKKTYDLLKERLKYQEKDAYIGKVTMGLMVGSVQSGVAFCSTMSYIDSNKKLFMTEDKAVKAADQMADEGLNYFRYLAKQNGLKFSFNEYQ